MLKWVGFFFFFPDCNKMCLYVFKKYMVTLKADHLICLAEIRPEFLQYKKI